MPRLPKYLRELPGEMVYVRCDRCGRYGRYKKWKLMKVLGPHIHIDQLIIVLAHRSCRQSDRRLRCVAYFEGPEG